MKNKNILKNWKVTVLFLVLLLAPIFVLALTLNVEYPPIPTPGGLIDLNNIDTNELATSDIVALVYSISIWLGGVIAFVYLVYAGFLYIFSGNAPGNRSKATGMITNIVWGVGILLLSYIILVLVNPDLVNLQDSSLYEITEGDTSFTIGNIENKLNFACEEDCTKWCNTLTCSQLGKEEGCALTAERNACKGECVGAHLPQVCDVLGTYSCAWQNKACIEKSNECTGGGAPSILCGSILEEETCNGFTGAGCSGKVFPPLVPPLTEYTCTWVPSKNKCLPTLGCSAASGFTAGALCDELGKLDCNPLTAGPYECIPDTGPPSCVDECIVANDCDAQAFPGLCKTLCINTFPACGLLTPPNMDGKKYVDGYYKLPQSEDGSYVRGTGKREDASCGTIELIQVIYTVAQKWKKSSGKTLIVRDLNGGLLNSGINHTTHDFGVDVDIDVAALNTAKRISLAKLFVDTGLVTGMIHLNATVREQVNAYFEATQPGIDPWKVGKPFMRPIRDTHGSHFHIRIGDGDGASGTGVKGGPPNTSCKWDTTANKNTRLVR